MSGSLPVAPVGTAEVLLFVPGTRPDRVAKALAAGADVVVVDLEDAVPPDAKDAARAEVDRLLGRGAALAVRINGADSPWHADDVAMVAAHGCAVMLPKAETGAVPDGVGPVLALVETALGLLDAPALAGDPRVVRLALGHLDLAAELGIDPDDRDAVRAARSALVIASAAAGLAPPVDGVTADVSDPDRLADDVRHARRLGLTGKLCIHPRQIDGVRAVLTPSADEVAWAERVLAADTSSGVAVVDGRMVDRPVVERARRIAARATTSS